MPHSSSKGIPAVVDNGRFESCASCPSEGPGGSTKDLDIKRHIDNKKIPNNIVDHLTHQIDKAIDRATARLNKLKQNTTFLAAVVEKNNVLIDDHTVKKQLLFQQIDNIRKSMPHREKLDLLPVNFMGLVTKILNE